jgi:hypothetical protein
MISLHSWVDWSKIEARLGRPKNHTLLILNSSISKMSNAVYNQMVSMPGTRAAYIPPHLRAKAAADAAKMKAAEPVDMNDAGVFPSLAIPVQPKLPHAGQWSAVASGQKKTFKQKIDDLIMFEAQSAIEREAAEHERQKMMGFVSLPLPITPEWLTASMERLRQAHEREIHLGRLKTSGMIDEELEPLPLPELSEMDRVLLEED